MFNFKRIAGLCAISAAYAVSFAAHAQTDTKTQAMTIVVPYGAGGIVDNTARAFAQKLATELGRPVVVENRGGAGGMIGMNTVARARDENTLGFTAVSPVTLSPHVMKTLYDPLKDLAPVAAVMYSPVYLVGGPKFTGKTFKDMLDQAKSDPNGLSLATAGVGSLGHLMLEQINGQANVRITHVPYKGMAQMVPDALGGQFTLMLVNASAPVNTLIDEGKLKLLAVGSPARLTGRPDAPTFAELGYPMANMTSTFGFFAPASTSPEFRTRMNAVINKVAALPDISKPLTEALNIMSPGSVEQFTAQVQKEYADNGKIVKAANIRSE
ncbi:tripartite tricarboxylate transporter substrate binding protein [Achromobacter seleniivolatilans]|uniref:Tripartite tricarboxylate transporter substrate binding protein n=1 Tax=Achromobacter seleniivolatilans TaxID=3047478 RepID=A0ABY9M428_9BURK|nr:tripartite tricarboxylate transporter substrate binding protein [Achromobacter sp. R39]WMD21751.1 tripartite tricarboxylate transporter substrate binding protein [Achromobacter sp. R39]